MKCWPLTDAARKVRSNVSVAVGQQAKGRAGVIGRPEPQGNFRKEDYRPWEREGRAGGTVMGTRGKRETERG